MGVSGGCGAYIYEECDYHGASTGFDPPVGGMQTAQDCKDWCAQFQVKSYVMKQSLTLTLFQSLGGCDYWVYNAANMTCNLLDSSNRTCWGLTGPKDPLLTDCTEKCVEEALPFIGGETLFLQPFENVIVGQGIG